MKKGVSNEERDKALKEMFGSETGQTTTLGDAQPIKREGVVATSERTMPNGADAHTPPEEGNEATGFSTAVPDTTDDPEMVAAPDEYGRATSSAPDRDGEISGRTIIAISDDEPAERSKVAVSTESNEATSLAETNVVGGHTLFAPPTPQSDQPVPSACSEETQHTAEGDPIRRTVKQRKSDLDEYRRRYMQIPRIEDRKPVFVSRITRDRLDRIVRLLGERGMSVSGLIENIALHHLAVHETDIEHWRKM